MPAFKLTFCWYRYATLQEALKSHQFRVLDVIDEEGNVLLQLEHEVRFTNIALFTQQLMLVCAPYRNRRAPCSTPPTCGRLSTEWALSASTACNESLVQATKATKITGTQTTTCSFGAESKSKTNNKK
jgi:hypothetical protein